MKLPEPRKFNYIYRYYKPEEDQEKKHIEFRRIRNTDPPQKGPTLRLVILLVIILGFIYFLTKESHNTKAPNTEIVIEEIQIVD